MYHRDGLNLYVYCVGNPMYYVEPSGHGKYPGESNRITDENFVYLALNEKDYNRLKLGLGIEAINNGGGL